MTEEGRTSLRMTSAWTPRPPGHDNRFIEAESRPMEIRIGHWSWEQAIGAESEPLKLGVGQWI